jgi:hypothetical protein
MKSFKRLSSWLAGAALVGLGLAVAPAAAANAAVTPAAVAAPGGATPNSIGAAVEFRNVNSGGCVDVFGGALQHGAFVGEFSCHNGANQNWLIEPVSSAPGFVALRNVNSNMCLDLHVGDISNVHDGTTIQQWDCFPDNISSEQWRLDVTNSGGPGTLTLTSAPKGLCLDTNPDTGSSVLHVATCTPGAFSQMWLEQ